MESDQSVAGIALFGALVCLLGVGTIFGAIVGVGIAFLLLAGVLGDSAPLVSGAVGVVVYGAVFGVFWYLSAHFVDAALVVEGPIGRGLSGTATYTMPPTAPVTGLEWLLVALVPVLLFGAGYLAGQLTTVPRAIGGLVAGYGVTLVVATTATLVVFNGVLADLVSFAEFRSTMTLFDPIGPDLVPESPSRVELTVTDLRESLLRSAVLYPLGFGGAVVGRAMGASDSPTGRGSGAARSEGSLGAAATTPKERAERLRDRVDADPESVATAVDELAALIGAEDDQTRRYAADALAIVAADRPDAVRSHVDALAEVLDDDNEHVRSHAARALAAVSRDHPGAVRTVAERVGARLPDESADARRYAAMTLANVAAEHPDAVGPAASALGTALSDDDDRVRRYGAVALARSAAADPDAVRPVVDELVSLLDDHEPDVRRRSRRAGGTRAVPSGGGPTGRRPDTGAPGRRVGGCPVPCRRRPRAARLDSGRRPELGLERLRPACTDPAGRGLVVGVDPQGRRTLAGLAGALVGLGGHQHRLAGRHALAGFDLQILRSDPRREQHVRPGAEGDVAQAVAPVDALAAGHVRADPAGDHPHDQGDGGAVVLDVELLVSVGAAQLRGPVAARLAVDPPDLPAKGRPDHVNVPRAEVDPHADPLSGVAVPLDHRHPAVRGRDDTGDRRVPVGIPVEVQHERRGAEQEHAQKGGHQHRRHRRQQHQPAVGQPAGRERRGDRGETDHVRDSGPSTPNRLGFRRPSRPPDLLSPASEVVGGVAVLRAAAAPKVT